MSDEPVVVAYDGSDAARAAVEAAVRLFPTHRLVVATVWEPGLAVALAPVRDPTGVGYSMPSAAEMEAVDRGQRDHAVDAAEQGMRLATEGGATAQAVSLPDDAGVAETIAAFADGCEACAIVVGSRGLGGVRRLFGSTSRGLLERAGRPVVVVRAPD
jgi:nucleotide-binding universal stress UspA family protein